MVWVIIRSYGNRKFQDATICIVRDKGLMETFTGNPGTRRGKASVRRTVAFDPFVERMIRRHEAEMLNAGWRNANFSLSTNMMVLTCFFDHAYEGESLHVET